MNATRMRACLYAMNWSQRDLARVLEYSFTTIQRWTQGKQPIREEVADWLEGLAAPHFAAPRPEGWKPARERRQDENFDGELEELVA